MLKCSNGKVLRGGGHSLKPPYARLFRDFKNLCHLERSEGSVPEQISNKILRLNPQNDNVIGYLCKGLALNDRKKCAFTLSELLLSLIIVGVVAIITVPVLINNVQKKVFATQVKNMVATIEQLAQDQMVSYKTRDLFNTDFGDPAKLMTDKNFAVAQACSTNDVWTKCWKTALTGKDKVVYKNLDKNNLSPCPASPSVILKNSATLWYGNIGQWCFLLDVNGAGKPNIIGRDLFAFCIDSKGHVFDLMTNRFGESTLDYKIDKCKHSKNYEPFWCYSALFANNWKMDY